MTNIKENMKLDYISNKLIVKIENCRECSNFMFGYCGELERNIDKEVILEKRNFCKDCPLEGSDS